MLGCDALESDGLAGVTRPAPNAGAEESAGPESRGLSSFLAAGGGVDDCGAALFGGVLSLAVVSSLGFAEAASGVRPSEAARSPHCPAAGFFSGLLDSDESFIWFGSVFFYMSQSDAVCGCRASHDD